MDPLADPLPPATTETAGPPAADALAATPTKSVGVADSPNVDSTAEAGPSRTPPLSAKEEIKSPSPSAGAESGTVADGDEQKSERVLSVDVLQTQASLMSDYDGTPGSTGSYDGSLNTPGGTGTPGTAGSRRRRRKQKEVEIVISLYVDKVPYEFGLECTFCTRNKAINHCSECSDFFCGPCDKEMHRHKKRKHHMRTLLSLLSKDAASTKIQSFFLMLKYRAYGRTTCRRQYERFFDKQALQWYYHNQRTGMTHWHRPKILGTESLRPFPSEQLCAFRVQGLMRMWQSRLLCRQQVQTQFDRVYDGATGRFFYFYKGLSPLMARATWKTPYCLRGKDIMPLLSEDVAALLIQRAWRSFSTKRMLRTLCRQTYRMELDPIEGTVCFRHTGTRALLRYKPLILGSEPWDPNEFVTWSLYQVCVFIRRLGLKKYVPALESFGVDGRLLSVFEWEDFQHIGLENRVHIRMILTALERLLPASKRPRKQAIDIFRRNQIRQHKRMEKASLICQRYFRGYRARVELARLREIERVRLKDIEAARKLKDSSVWWTAKVPVPHDTCAKEFGRRRDFRSAVGFGRWEGERWVPQKKGFSDLPLSVRWTSRLDARSASELRASVLESADFAGITDV